MSGDPVSLRDTWLDLDGRRLLYRTNAESPPPADAPVLIHVHGFAISGRYLMPTAWRLAPEFRTYVPDLPGFGKSERPPHPYDIPELADALARFMDAVGVERATLLGNSLGCPIIGEFLDHFPDRAERVIFVSPAGGLYNQPFPEGPLAAHRGHAAGAARHGQVRHHRLSRLWPGRDLQPRQVDARLPDDRADRRADAADARRAGQPRPVRQRAVGQATGERPPARHRGDHPRRRARDQLLAPRAAGERRPQLDGR